MKLSTFLLGGVAFMGLSSAAFAADLIVDAPMAAPVVALSSTDWSGFYVGVHGGYGAGTLNLSAPGFIDPDDEDEDVSGFFGGIQLGYNFQSDALLFGLQTDLSLSGITSDEDGAGENDTVDWLGSTTGRIGFVADSFVPYLKGGIAYAGGTGWAEDESDSQTHIGWTVGAGVELAVADNISVFAEYDYYDFGEATYDFTPFDADVTSTLNAVKVGLNVGF
jgi:opacity protein-like surface antigen